MIFNFFGNKKGTVLDGPWMLWFTAEITLKLKGLQLSVTVKVCNSRASLYIPHIHKIHKIN